MSNDCPPKPHRNEAPAAEKEGQQVGYCNPPMASQYKPGQSGNPLGRPKGSLSFASELVDELSETIAVSGDVRITKKRAIVKKLVAAAIAGDAKVASILISICSRLPSGKEADPRAADDEAFVQKLSAREPQAAETVGSTISSPSPRETENDE